jgi:hypothetical protein
MHANLYRTGPLIRIALTLAALLAAAAVAGGAVWYGPQTVFLLRGGN